MRMESSSPAGGSVTSIIHQDAQALLRQQLELMASGVFRWHGDIWPDVPMEWEIEEGAQESSGENPAPWSTRLHLTMPSLGAIELRLMLTGDRLQIRGVDLSAETAQQL